MQCKLSWWNRVTLMILQTQSHLLQNYTIKADSELCVCVTRVAPTQIQEARLCNLASALSRSDSTEALKAFNAKSQHATPMHDASLRFSGWLPLLVLMFALHSRLQQTISECIIAQGAQLLTLRTEALQGLRCRTVSSLLAASAAPACACSSFSTRLARLRLMPCWRACSMPCSRVWMRRAHSAQKASWSATEGPAPPNTAVAASK